MKNLLQPNQIVFWLYFNEKFVGYEKWTEGGWMYSQDKKHWDFTTKYAHNQKLLMPPTGDN